MSAALPFFSPDEPTLVPFLGRLEHEPDPLLVRLPLQAWEPASFAPEADPPGFAHAHAIGGVIGTTRQGLGGIGIEVVSNPGGIRLGGKGMQGVFRKAELEASRRKGGGAGLFVGTRNETGRHAIGSQHVSGARVSWPHRAAHGRGGERPQNAHAGASPAGC